MAYTVHCAYFSPTHATEKIVAAITGEVIRLLPQAQTGQRLNQTPPSERKLAVTFSEDDLLILGLPVYAGRVPAIMLPFLKGLRGQNTPAVIVAVYGNRHYEDCLLEMQDLLQEAGFITIAAGAFIGEHSYSRLAAAGRPDAQDLQLAEALAVKAAEKLPAGSLQPVKVAGNFPYRTGMTAAPRAPKTNDSCTACLLCADHCPSGAISFSDPRLADEAVCISCCACVKACPQEAKYFDDEGLLQRKALIEGNFLERREPELFC